MLSALRRLPARQREALVLRFYLDLPEPEIARSMGVSQGTVKSTTSRALAALGRLVQEAGHVTMLEDRVRAATQAIAGTVAPGSAPPLRLPGAPTAARARRWAHSLTPAAAALAVTAVVLGMPGPAPRR